MTDVVYQNGWAVPAGWKLVPEKPTYELECEVGGVRMDEEFFLYEYADHEKIGEICRAVVKYSPPPPKAPDYTPGPLEVSVIGMPEFDALLDHIYEEGTGSEGVIHLANKLVRTAIQSHIQHARNATPVAYKWGGVLIRAEESLPVHRKEGQPLYAAPVSNQQTEQKPVTPDDYKTPCDVMLPPATRIKRGCSLNTLMVAMAQRESLPPAQRVFAAQQPVAGEEIMVNTPYDVYTLPLHPSGLSSGPRYVVHVPGPEQPAEQKPAPDYAFMEAMKVCEEGLREWREKPHNRRWWKRIDGTPIPNDLLCCIAEALAAQHRGESE